MERVNMYEHTQFGRTILIALAACGVVMGAIAAIVRDPAGWIVYGAVVVVLALTCWMCSSLTVRIDDESLEVRLGPGLFRRRFLLEEIRGAEPVRNPWWYGYGIHSTPHGWLWNVSGPDAVELLLADGRRFRVGTDEPQRLAEAIRRATAPAERAS